MNWERFAEQWAKDAYENYFQERRGVWSLGAQTVIYNNNPYAADPGARDRETAELRRRLAAAGIQELGYATYPPAGQESAGYTYAMVLAGGKDLVDLVASIQAEVTYQTQLQLCESGAA